MAMPLPALIAIFIVVPLAELYVILKVGDAIGAGWTILLLAADSVLGAVLLRSQGRTVWRRFNEALSAGRMPHREVMDGVLVIFGGAFLITPGFLTDIVGLILLIPPTRAVVRRLASRRLDRRVQVGMRHRPARTARAVSGEAFALSFFDPDRELYGIARSGSTILFEGRTPGRPRGRAGARGGRRRLARRAARAAVAAPRAGQRRARPGRRHGARLPRERRGERPRRVVPRHLLDHDGHPALGGARRDPQPLGAGRRAATACSRSRGGRAAPRATARSSCARACSSTASCARSRRRASRPSTTATGASAAPGSSCGCPGEEFPRRGSGLVIAGSSLELDPVRVHAAVFRWRLDGREGIGAYELMVRVEPPAAA